MSTFTNRSLINYRKELWEYCQHFSQCLKLDENANRYNCKLEAIQATLQNIVYRSHLTWKIIILTDWELAIEGIFNCEQTNKIVIWEIRNLIKAGKVKNK